MRLFVVRHIEDKQAVGVFWVDHESNLPELIDVASDPEACEYRVIDDRGGIIWDDFAPPLGVRFNDEGENDTKADRLFAKSSFIGKLEDFIFGQSAEDADDYWVPVLAIIQEWPIRLRKPSTVPTRIKAATPEKKLRPPPPDITDVQTVVYFIQGADHIKIGTTNGPVEKRLKALSTAHHTELRLLATEVDTDNGGLEFRLHERFAHLRARGEWFRAGPELLTYIEEVKARK